MDASAGRRDTPEVSGVSSVGKAATVLRSFTPTVEVLSVRQLATRTGVPRSTVHALCATLCREGMLEPVLRRGYRLGPLLVGLGGQIIERIGLVEAARDSMSRLLRTGVQEAHLGQLADGWVVYLHRVCGDIRSPMANRVGLRAPAFRTGCGKAALAPLGCDEAVRRVRRTCRAEKLRLPDLPALREELGRAREQGYVVSQSFQPGRTSVAAWVLAPGGVSVGGVSVAAPTATFSTRAIRQAAEDVTAVAAEVSERLATQRVVVAPYGEAVPAR